MATKAKQGNASLKTFVSDVESKEIVDETCILTPGSGRSMTPAKQEVKVEEEFTVEISFDNPLPVKLTECVLGIEGPGIQKQIEIKQKDVDARKTFKTTVSLTAKKAGNREIIACFNSKELIGITGSCNVNVS